MNSKPRSLLRPAVLEDEDEDAVRALPTESRLRTIAFAAITTDRNDSSIRQNANSNTNPKTSGAETFIWSLKSLA